MGLDAIILLSLSLLIAIAAKRKQDGKKLQIQGAWPFAYMITYNTEAGIGAMDRTAKRWPLLTGALGWMAIVTGLVGMVCVSSVLVYTTVQMFFSSAAAAPQVALVLPVKAPGVFYVEPVQFLLIIAILMAVHEFGHGLIARHYKWSLKKTGVGALCLFIPIIPIAFVSFAGDDCEREKNLRVWFGRPLKERLAVLGAGANMNFVLALLLTPILFFGTKPYLESMMSENLAFSIASVVPESPAAHAGISPGEKIMAINGQALNSAESYKRLLSGNRPGTTLLLTTDKGDYALTLFPSKDDPQRGIMGVSIGATGLAKEEYRSGWRAAWFWTFEWFHRFLALCMGLNLGIGLMNLLPLSITDGGQIALNLFHRCWGKMVAVALSGLLTFFFLWILFLQISSGFGLFR